MAVFIELVTEPFDTSFKNKVKRGSQAGAGMVAVRRPMRGVEIKEDTHAYLKLIRVDGVEIPLLDSSNSTGESKAYANFILQSVQDSRMERHQIVETFGETYLYLFGEAPHMLNIQATVLNSFDFNWKAEFIENYKRYLRGTRCVELGARCYLFYDDNIIEGYILNAQMQETADNPMVIPLSFQFFVTNEQNISLVGSPDFPISSSVILPEGVTLTEPLNGEQVDLLLAQTIEGKDFYKGHPWNIKGALRGKIAENYDEYTWPLHDTAGQIEQQRILEDVNNIVNALHQGMSSYGVDPKSMGEPGFFDKIGFGPSFGGKGATFGASPTPGQLFSGLKEIAKGAENVLNDLAKGNFKQAGKDLYESSKNADEAIGGPLGGFFNKVGNDVEGAKNKVTSTYKDVASKFPNGVTPSALASAVQGAVEGLAGEAWNAAKKTAETGGYSSSQSYLASTGTSLGASQSGSTGYGPVIQVGGKATAFAFVSAQGSITQVGTPPNQAMQSTEPTNSWHKAWAWPSPQ